MVDEVEKIEEPSIDTSQEEFESFRKALTPRQWVEIEELWASGNHTLKDLSKSYGVSVVWISNQLSKRGVKKGSSVGAIREKIKETIKEEQIKDSVKVLERARETREDHYKYSQALSKLLYSKVAKQVVNNEPVANIKEDIRAIKDAMMALSMARSERWIILGLDKNSGLGEEQDTLLIREMNDDDIEVIRRAQAEERGDKTLDPITELEKDMDKTINNMTK
jgi:hypothetical protein